MASECTESTSLRFEWVLRGLGELFENSKGETKSKVTKSARFGGGRWQILFYANSGTMNAEGHGYVSLYLSCEPTAEEKEAAVDGKWVREGVYKFGFEVRSTLQKTIVYNAKEANDHSFSYKTVNWGWAQFARRDAIYYQSASVRQQDAIIITCSITSSPSAPVGAPAVPRQLVPKFLLGSIGGLLDDPIYSDLEFIIPRRRGDRKGIRRIFAAKRLLKRVEYFDTMFRSDFAEGACTDRLTTDLGLSSISTAGDLHDTHDAVHDEDDNRSYVFEDSDDEDDEDEDDDCFVEVAQLPNDLELTQESSEGGDSRPLSWTSLPEGDVVPSDADEQEGRNVKQKISHPSSPRSERAGAPLEHLDTAPPAQGKADVTKEQVPGPAKLRVVVKDAAYATYRAVLYYIYTDTIIFAPLASTFHGHQTQQTGTTTSESVVLGKARNRSNNASSSTPAATAEGPTFPFSKTHDTLTALSQPLSRREWIAEWERRNPDRPRPCSAKAVYRLADKLDLQELKDRAFQHIIKSLTVENVAYEVFSDFSAAFEDVRRVQVAYFLEHWQQIRGSDAMRNVWQQIRLGRHPGFEEVWPLIALNLEFKPVAECDGAEEGKQ